MGKRTYSESGLDPAIKVQACAAKRNKVEPGAQSKGGVKIPSPTNDLFTKWELATLPSEYPPLPPILDSALEKKAFTHRSEADGEWNGYDRLEWVGDAWLEVIATSFIDLTFPRLHSGKCAQLREICICNQTLAEFTRHYKLADRAKLPPELRPDAGREIQASQAVRTKVLGDLFESYVGAVIKSDPENGVKRASEWLKPLFGMKLKMQIQKEEAYSQGSHNGQVREKDSAKEALTRAIGVKGVQITYESVSQPKKSSKETKLTYYSMGCFLTGWGENHKLLAIGTALGKKEAGQLAAEKVMNNKPLLSLYVSRKKAFEEAQQIQGQSTSATIKVEETQVKIEESQSAV